MHRGRLLPLNTVRKGDRALFPAPLIYDLWDHNEPKVWMFVLFSVVPDKLVSVNLYRGSNSFVGMD